MVDIKIPTSYLRAANLCVADKNDLRKTLKAIHLNKEGYIESSNGHLLLRIPCPSLRQLTKSVLFPITTTSTTIPKGSKHTIISINETNGDVNNGDIKLSFTGYKKNESLVTYLHSKVLDKCYPNLGKHIPNKTYPVESIGINLNYLGIAEKVYKILCPVGSKYTTIKLVFSGNLEPVVLKPALGDVEFTFIIMPCRIKD